MQDGRRLKMFACSRGAGENKNSRADNGANPQRGQRPRPQFLLESVPGLVGVGDQLVDGFTAEKLAARGSGGRFGIGGGRHLRQKDLFPAWMRPVAVPAACARLRIPAMDLNCTCKNQGRVKRPAPEIPISRAWTDRAPSS